MDKNREKLHTILDMVLDCNGFEERQREKTGYLPTVFLSFNGHVSMLNVDVCPNGWESGCERKTFSFDVSRPMPSEEIDKLRKCLADALNSTTPEQALALEIAEIEKEIEEQKKKVAAMKKKLTKVRKEGGAA